MEDDSDCNCCSSPYLTISYSCDKCGCQDFPELPQLEQLNDWLTSALDNFDRNILLESYKIKQNKLEEQRKK